MKFLLAAVNAKYIHSNLGIYSLKQYADKKLSGPPEGVEEIRVELGEYTINHQTAHILQDIYKRKPEAVGFSCYIWNISQIRQLIRDLKKILPATGIWLGGPEVSYQGRELLKEEPGVKGIMKGEGEETFYRLLLCAERGREGGMEWKDASLSQIPGLVFRCQDGSLKETSPAPLLELGEIPFPYQELSEFRNRIIYYESSRGCPFSCSYCLSSIDKTVRFRDLALVRQELDFFLGHRVPQVKFVDRTFNCKKSHAMAIWSYIRAHDNGVTNFHFEIAGDLLDQEELSLLSQMRPGLIQLEIGVQTVNEDTLCAIRRKTDLGKLRENVRQINGFQNIHQHLDLIAGLPYEGYESFQNSFNQVFSMEPSQLQLGFLKVLKGSHMMEAAGEYGLLFGDGPPYEILATRWLSYGEVTRLKAVEDMVETYYNSGQFLHTMKKLSEDFPSPFAMFEALGKYYETNGLSGLSHRRTARYELLFAFIRETLTGKSSRAEAGCDRAEAGCDRIEAGRDRIEAGRDRAEVCHDRIEAYRDRLTVDLYLRENVKSRPAFCRDQAPYKEVIRALFREEEKSPCYLRGYEGYDARQLGKMVHIEVLRDGRLILFDYKNREPLFGNARAVEVHPVTCIT